jgi:AraC-like DNA-binding protein
MDKELRRISLMGTFELAVVGLAGSGIGTALGLPMLWPESRTSGTRLMGAWLIAVSAVVAIISGRLLGFVPGNAAAEHAINLLGLGAYPLLYLYIRQQTRTSALPFRAFWLWAPAAVYLAALIARSALGASTRVPFPWILPVLVAFTLWCATLLAGRQTVARPSIVPAVWVVTFLAVLNIAQTIRMLFGHVPPIRALVPVVLTLEFVSVVALVAWRASRSTPAVMAESPRYEKSTLDESDAAALLAAIDRALTHDRLFTETDLTLARLAAAAGSSAHQVSEVLNRYAGVSFNELVCRHRVNDVKAQLQDPAADRFTIEGIGASAGFGSRSALYAAFKRLEGMTPAEFRARRS